MKKYTVAVVGATGVVGREIIHILEHRQFPVEKLIPLASERSEGQLITFQNKPIRVQVLNETAFEGIHFALFSAGGSVSKTVAPQAVAHGAIVIDNTSHFRMDPDIPLVVPEVNGDAIRHHKGIIANPNCSTAQMVMVLKPIHAAATIERVVVSTYQSVSGAGKKAMDELETQARANLSGRESAPSKFPHPIAFNLLPHIDAFLDNGYTKEEMKMIQETKKILDAPSLAITATAVRVPVFISHSESINIQTRRKITVEETRNLLKNFPGVAVIDNPSKNEYPTPRDISGKDDIYVGRIREDVSIPNGIELWCVGDNLRKGAALNAVQIAEYIVKHQLPIPNEKAASETVL